VLARVDRAVEWDREGGGGGKEPVSITLQKKKWKCGVLSANSKGLPFRTRGRPWEAETGRERERGRICVTSKGHSGSGRKGGTSARTHATPASD